MLTIRLKVAVLGLFLVPLAHAEPVAIQSPWIAITCPMRMQDYEPTGKTPLNSMLFLEGRANGLNVKNSFAFSDSRMSRLGSHVRYDGKKVYIVSQEQGTELFIGDSQIDVAEFIEWKPQCAWGDVSRDGVKVTNTNGLMGEVLSAKRVCDRRNYGKSDGKVEVSFRDGKLTPASGDEVNGYVPSYVEEIRLSRESKQITIELRSTIESQPYVPFTGFLSEANCKAFISGELPYYPVR